MSKRVIENQKYEKYWSLTVEYSDINSHYFINTLKNIVDFIDRHPELHDAYSSELYQKLQGEIVSVFPKKNLASTRKSINQFVKLGFIYPKLRGYRKSTLDFINSKSDESRALIFSEIFYQYSNFDLSVKNDFSKLKQVNFFVKTLMHLPTQKITEDNLKGFLITDINLYSKGYLSEGELYSQTQLASNIQFEKRKYNQLSYFTGFLKYIPGIKFNKIDGSISYIEEDYLQFRDASPLKRDLTLFRIMKEKLKQESLEKYGKLVCFSSKREIKGLVASHIVPLGLLINQGRMKEAYDVNNTILLEPNIDAYFDKGDITFDYHNGKMVYGKNLATVFQIYPKKDLDLIILNEERRNYLEVHNDYYKTKHN